MTKLINKDFGTEMWVADNRRDEYIAAGHKLAAKPAAVKTTEKKPKPKKENKDK